MMRGKRCVIANEKSSMRLHENIWAGYPGKCGVIIGNLYDATC
jgi:hypothetical protein